MVPTLPDYFQGRLFWDFELLEVGAVAVIFGLFTLAVTREDAEFIRKLRAHPVLDHQPGRQS
jgi:hypothetical protein